MIGLGLSISLVLLSFGFFQKGHFAAAIRHHILLANFASVEVIDQHIFYIEAAG